MEAPARFTYLVSRRFTMRPFPNTSPLAILLLGILPVLATTGCGGKSAEEQPARVTLYCALDREFSEAIINDVNAKKQLVIAPHFDTEANKSVGLFNELVREKDVPRCDVYWNNEILNTIRLQKLGLLEPYDSPSAKPFPQQFKAADHTWHAFAARARVLLVNTKLVADADRPTSILDMADPRWRGQVAMAKPQFGTTATHAACLFAAWGPDKARKYYKDLQNNEVQIVAGNKQVAEGVGKGQFAFGITDTDDAMGEIKAGKPVAMIFPDQGEGKVGTLFIPNTVALIKGAPNPEGGKKLIDYLLTPEVEAKLAQADGCQIPLNPNVKVTLATEVEAGRKARPMAVDFAAATEQWDPAQEFLRDLFAK
jgi:iron(III) transport system substrate-binding protein